MALKNCIETPKDEIFFRNSDSFLLTDRIKHLTSIELYRRKEMRVPRI